MGRRRRVDLDLPPRMFRRGERYYYGRAGLALGKDLRAALHKYAELETGILLSGKFSEAATRYLKSPAFASKATKTQKEYERQARVLIEVFGEMPFDGIKPSHIYRYMRERGGSIAATREKALFSIIWNHARECGLTDLPAPTIGVRGKTAKRNRYVKDDELAAALTAADPELGLFLELCYRTGQRPSDVLKFRRQDIQDGDLWVEQAKTGAKVRISLAGPLERFAANTGVASAVWLIHDKKGQRFSLHTMQRRFAALGFDWQIRDLRRKAASDARDAQHAQALLGHAAATTTDRYIQRAAGQRVQPITRKIGEE